jgi:hypothetical protein
LDFRAMFAPASQEQDAPDFRAMFAPGEAPIASNPYNDEGPSWSEQPAPDWRDAEATANLTAIGGAPAEEGYRGAVLPFKMNAQGQRELAVPSMIQDPATLPGDVYAGNVNPAAVPDRTLGFAAAVIGARPMAGKRVAGTPEAAPQPPKELPTTQSLKESASALYREADEAGLAIHGNSYGRLVAEITNKAKGEGLNRRLHPGSFAAIRQLIADVPKDVPAGAMSKITGIGAKPSTKAFSLEEIDTLRKTVGAARRSKSPDLADDRRIAGIVADRIDDWLDNLGTKDIAAGDQDAAVKAIRAARGIVVRVKKSEILDEAMENALDRVGANYTNAGLQTALRQEFKRIKKAKHLFRKFSPQEQSVIQSIVRGASAENILRWAGKFSPTSPLSAVVAMFAGSPGGVAGQAALMGGGALAAKASAKMGQKKVDQLNALVRRGYESEDSSFAP